MREREGAAYPMLHDKMLDVDVRVYRESKMPMLVRRTSHFTDWSACSSVIKCSTISTYIQPIPPRPSGYRRCSAKTQYMTTLKPALSCTAEASQEVEKKAAQPAPSSLSRFPHA